MQELLNRDQENVKGDVKERRMLVKIFTDGAARGNPDGPGGITE